MKSVLLEFQEKIKKLIEYLSILDDLKKIDLTIITIYGILEGYIESVIIAYLHEINKIYKKYEEMPEEIIQKHLKLSSQLITNTNSKYEHITHKSIIENLYKCLSGNDIYILNYDAFTQHTANFRKNIISDVFNNIGIMPLSAHPALKSIISTAPTVDVLYIGMMQGILMIIMKLHIVVIVYMIERKKSLTILSYPIQISAKIDRQNPEYVIK